ncbi:MAG: solute carrier family 26 protein [Flavobacteriales bacterium]|nr:solute carrier family 26 protein [Flavobacteriales bacterium]
MKKFIPILDWINSYDKSWFKSDLFAGLTVGVMLIPQGMAYSLIAGLPAIYGLYASIIPLIIYAIFGTSRQLAVGPVAMVSLLVASGVGVLAESGTEEYIALAILLALMVGVMQFVLGVARMGFLVNFMSHPVISGFTSAAALIIGFSQLKHVLGVNIPKSHFIHEILINAATTIGEWNWTTVALSLGGMIVIILTRKYVKAIPAQLAAVVLGILVVYFFGLDQSGVKIVGEVPSGLPSLQVGNFNWAQVQSLLPTALTISLIGFMESFAVAKTIQAKHRNYEVKANQELIGLGLANVAGSFFQSFPVTGGFSRTAVNDQAGAKTGLAAIISATLIAVTLLFLTPLFYYLPKAILASVIMVAVFGLVDFKEPVHLWKSDRVDFAMLLITFVGTLFLGVEQGIGLGVLLSLLLIIFKTTRPHIAVLGQVPGTNVYRNVERFDQIIERRDIVILRPDARIYFANINHIQQKIDEVVKANSPEIKGLVVNFESVNSVDSSGIHFIKDVDKQLKAAGIKLIITSVKGPVRDTFQKSGLTSYIGENRFALTVHQGVKIVESEESPKFGEYILEAN